MTRPLKILLRADLSWKGISWSRQHIKRKVRNNTFPPPDGKTTDAPNAPDFWFESTIDGYLLDRAEKLRAVRQAAAEKKDTVAAD
jgi:hypothetical protein